MFLNNLLQPVIFDFHNIDWQQTHCPLCLWILLVLGKILIKILDHQAQKLKNNEIASMNILWRNQLVKGAT